jgi:hypothetical protein
VSSVKKNNVLEKKFYKCVYYFRKLGPEVTLKKTADSNLYEPANSTKIHGRIHGKSCLIGYLAPTGPSRDRIDVQFDPHFEISI